jgi:hypothetical protein
VYFPVDGSLASEAVLPPLEEGLERRYDDWVNAAR